MTKRIKNEMQSSHKERRHAKRPERDTQTSTMNTIQYKETTKNQKMMQTSQMRRTH